MPQAHGRGFRQRVRANLVEAASAGLEPAKHISRRTVAVMDEKNIHLDGHAPCPLADFDLDSFDLIVNLSGRSLPPTGARVLPVPLPDPARGDVNLHRQVRDSVERVVRTLLMKLHSAREMAA